MADPAKGNEVFIIEDDIDLSALVKFVLESEGLKVKAETDGMQALASLEGGYLPDLILLDIMLPGIDGFQILRKLKEDSQTKSIPVVIVSAKVAEKDVSTGLELGASAYVKKPIDLPELIEIAKTNLKKR